MKFGKVEKDIMGTAGNKMIAKQNEYKVKLIYLVVLKRMPSTVETHGC